MNKNPLPAGAAAWCQTRSLALAPLALVLTLAAGPAAAVTMLDANAFARIGSGNVTQLSDDVSGFPLPDNGSTGVQMVNNGNLQAAAEAAALLASNAIGASSVWNGTSILTTPNSGPNNFIASGATSRYLDTLTVTSPTLAVGTPVGIDFSLFVSSLLFVQHSGVFAGPSQDAFASASLTANITGNAGPGFFLAANDNAAIKSTDPAIADFAIGLLNPATPSLDFTIASEVGDTFTFNLQVSTNTNGDVRPETLSLNPLVIENVSGVASAAIGVAFGATPDNPNAVLLSEQYGNNPLPGAAAAMQANAQQAAPDLGVVPVPAALPLLASGVALLAGLSRTRRRA